MRSSVSDFDSQVPLQRSLCTATTLYIFQFSPLTDWVIRGHMGQFSRDPFSVFSAGGPCEQFWHGQRCPLFDVVHPAFPLPITALPTLQDALKDVLVEAVVECDMPKPCKFPSLDSCQKRFQWTNKEVDLAPHPVVGLVLQVGICRSFLMHLSHKSKQKNTEKL